MKFDRNKDGGEDEEDRVPAAEAARRRFFPPPGKTMMNEENALRTFREGGEGLGFKTATKKEKKQNDKVFTALLSPRRTRNQCKRLPFQTLLRRKRRLHHF